MPYDSNQFGRDINLEQLFLLHMSTLQTLVNNQTITLQEQSAIINEAVPIPIDGVIVPKIGASRQVFEPPFPNSAEEAATPEQFEKLRVLEETLEMAKKELKNRKPRWKFWSRL